MKWWGIVTAIVVVVIIAASSQSNPSPTATNTGAGSSQASSSGSSATSEPTPARTPTPKPTPTPPPTPLPTLTWSGRGDAVEKLPAQFSGPELATITYSGGDNFIVNGLDASNQDAEGIVNTIGAYQGVDPVGFDSAGDVSIQIQASGPWTIVLHDPSTARAFNGTVSGSGDDLLLYTGPTGVAAITNAGGDNFIVNSYGTDGSLSNGMVNVIGAYNGSVPIDSGPIYIAVQSTSKWTIAASAS